MFVRVTVKAKAKKDQVFPQKEGKFLVHTRQPAKEGRANQRVHLLLADYFHISPKKIKLVRGGTMPCKLFEIYDGHHQGN